MINKQPRTINFLVELLISIIFLTFGCFVCVVIFVKAHDYVKLTKAINQATLVIQTYIANNHACQSELVEFDEKWQLGGRAYRLKITTINQIKNANSTLIGVENTIIRISDGYILANVPSSCLWNNGEAYE